METPSETTSPWALRVRRFLIAGIGALVLLLILTPQDRPLNPLNVQSARATGVGAAPGFLLLTDGLSGVDARFYLVDTSTNVMAVYATNSEKIRLLTVRNFDKDTDIVDASITIQGPDGRPIQVEGGSGIDQKAAGYYADKLKEFLDKIDKTKIK